MNELCEPVYQLIKFEQLEAKWQLASQTFNWKSEALACLVLATLACSTTSFIDSLFFCDWKLKNEDFQNYSTTGINQAQTESADLFDSFYENLQNLAELFFADNVTILI